MSDSARFARPLRAMLLLLLLQSPAYAATADGLWIDPEADEWELEAIAPSEVPQDGEEARRLSKLAKQQRDAEAAFQLAYAYATKSTRSLGTGESPADVLFWSQLGAEAGSPESAYMAGRHYLRDARPVDRKTALAFLLRAAKAGVLPAQFVVGNWQSESDAERSAIGDAADWLRRAAERGDAPAQMALGQLLAARRDPLAEAWLRRSAEQSFLPGQVALGDWYAQGEPPRWAIALRWYERAARHGNVLAMRRLAACFEHGRGVPVRPGAALDWFVRAATEPEEKADAALRLLTGLPWTRDQARAIALIRRFPPTLPSALALQLGQELTRLKPDGKIELLAVHWLALSLFGGAAEAEPVLQAHLRSLSPAQVAKAVAEVEALYRRERPKDPKAKLIWTTAAAEYGIAEAQYDLGYIYDREPDVAPRDVARMLLWYRRAAEQGDRRAVWQLGQWEQAQRSRQPRPSVDIAALERAAGSDPAKMAELGKLYDAPPTPGVDRNVARAIAWYRRAAYAGNMSVLSRLTYLLESDPAGPRDPVQAMPWIRNAAVAGKEWAMLALGKHYKEGRGVPRDPAQAIVWLEKLAWAGDARAIRELAGLYEGSHGLPAEPAKVLFWLRAGADGLDPFAFRRMGELSEAGRFVPRSLPEAYKWYRLSVRMYSTQAPAKLAQLEARMSPGEIEDGKRLLARWVLGHEGDFRLKPLYPEAYAALGLKTPGAGKEAEEEVFRRLKVLADCGSASAMTSLGFHYLHGDEMVRNPRLGEAWYLKAAEAGDLGAQLNLVSLYVSGSHVPKDLARAYTWWLIAQARRSSPSEPPGYLRIEELSPNARDLARKHAEDWLLAHPRLPRSTHSVSD